MSKYDAKIVSSATCMCDILKNIYNAFYRRNHFFLPYLYAQIYWLAEFGDVFCLQFNYLRVKTLTPTWEDFVGQF
jgi:hypothetical protein